MSKVSQLGKRWGEEPSRLGLLSAQIFCTDAHYSDGIPSHAPPTPSPGSPLHRSVLPVVSWLQCFFSNPWTRPTSISLILIWYRSLPTSRLTSWHPPPFPASLSLSPVTTAWLCPGVLSDPWLDVGSQHTLELNMSDSVTELLPPQPKVDTPWKSHMAHVEEQEKWWRKSRRDKWRQKGSEG